ncbi:hypothetical protein MJO28_008440 [Puccinia striiformis f. sp. tritici]|uniref:Uncharacterized protein n=1 Tax=Puccinia striiformis f. sp. tritici TaxID=168172 RepID=A0ACC0EBE7_9BASI|nr:hypothetical protein MJO28_008440 [Puccinia striiformis f. sp. tritici]
MDFYTPAPLTRHIAGESFSETGQHSTLPDGLPFQTPCPAYYDAVPNLDGSFSRGRSPQLFITSRPAITQTSSSTQPTLHMSQQQPIVLEPRMFDCAVSLLIWIEKKHKNRKSTWKGIRLPKDLSIQFNSRAMDWDTFKSPIKLKCSKTYAKIPQMIEDATNSSPPKLPWCGYIHRNTSWPKTKAKSVANQTSFAMWMQAISKGKSTSPHGGILIKMPNPRDKIEEGKNEDLISKAVRRAQARKDNACARKRVGPSPAPTPSESLTAPHTPSTLVSHLRPTSTNHSEQIQTSTLQERLPSNDEDDESGDDDSEGEITGDEFSTKDIIAEEIYALYPFDPAYDPVHPVYLDPINHKRKIILTTGNVAVWSKAVRERVDGVSVHSPPRSLHWVTHKPIQHSARSGAPSAVDPALLAAVAVQMANQFSQMHNPASMGGAPVTPVNPNLQPPPVMAASGRGSLTDYLRYVGITNIDATLATLTTHEIDHYEMFKPDFLSLEQLEKLGLGVGTLGKLRRHVAAYELSLAENAQ